MKFESLRRGALSCLMLVALAACGGGNGSDAGSGSSPGTTATRIVQPREGVPVNTDPLPLPEPGVAYDNPQPRENIQDGGELRLDVAELGPNFNSFHVDGGTAYVHNLMTWVAPQLWRYSVTGVATPNTDYLLSAELISEDPETVRYVLHPEARWNDGTPIDWTAFETAWKTQSGTDPRYNPQSTVGYDSIASVSRGETDKEVIVTFARPFYPFEYLFQELPHPKNSDPDFFRTGWINQLNPELLAGPFTIGTLSETRLVLVRNPAWWGEPAKLDRVIYLQMEDQASINAFQNGETDAVSVYSADRRRQIRNMSDVQIRRGYAAFTAVFTMGQDSELFSDPNARRAFVLGTDRALLREIRFQGLDWEEPPPGSVLMMPWQDGYEDNLVDLHYDPAAAARVLDEGGWVPGDDGYRYKDGRIASFRFVTFGDDPMSAALARAQQQMARSIGLRMEIDNRKSADFSPTITSGDFDVVLMGWRMSDPYGYVSACQLFCSDSESNYSRLGTPAIDELLRQPGTIPDRAAAYAAANRAEREALQLIGTYPLFNGPLDYAVRKGLANFGSVGFASPERKNVGWQIAD